MWTERHRAKQVRQAHKVKRCPSDLTDAEWQAIEPLLPRPAANGRHWATDLREVMNAIRYLVRSGCEWRMLPVHFPLGKRCTGADRRHPYQHPRTADVP